MSAFKKRVPDAGGRESRAAQGPARPEAILGPLGLFVTASWILARYAAMFGLVILAILVARIPASSSAAPAGLLALGLVTIAAVLRHEPLSAAAGGGEPAGGGARRVGAALVVIAIVAAVTGGAFFVASLLAVPVFARYSGESGGYIFIAATVFAIYAAPLCCGFFFFAVPEALSGRGPVDALANGTRRMVLYLPGNLLLAACSVAVIASAHGVFHAAAGRLPLPFAAWLWHARVSLPLVWLTTVWTLRWRQLVSFESH